MHHIFQVMRRAATWAFANTASTGRAPMGYCVQMTYVTNEPTRVKILLPTAPSQMIHALQINVSNHSAGVYSLVAPHWKHGWTLLVLQFLT